MKVTGSGIVLGPALLRLSAYLIDAAIIVIIFFALIQIGIVRFNESEGLSGPADRLSYVLLIIIAAVYHIGFVAAKSATPGKMTMNLYVAYPEGAAVRPDTAILRYIVLMVSVTLIVPALIDVVLLFADPNRRTLHDRVAGTMVLAGRPGAPLHPEDLGGPHP